MIVKLLEYPKPFDWIEVKRRALVTIGKEIKNPPSNEWMKSILRARHSPIRYLRFSFYIECPYWVSVHLCRHIHAQPYVRSQRNDRQDLYDRTKAPQDQMVSMIWDMDAEEFIIIANKRLCGKASAETREVVKMMCTEAINKCHEFIDELVPMCVREGSCHEMQPCGKRK